MPRFLLRAALCAIAVSFMALAVAHPVHAQAGASGKSSQEYKRVLQEAMAEYERSNWAEARALFEAAHEMQPTARTLRAIGMCSFEEKSYVISISYLGQALSDTRKPLTAEQRKQTEDALWRAHEFVAQYRLELTPSDAMLRVDGHNPFMEDGKLLLDAGTHKLTLSAEGYDTAEHTVTVRARESGELSVKLVLTGSNQPVAAAPEVQSVDTTQGATQSQTDAAPKGGLTKGQWAGIGLVGFGAVALGLGIGFGVDAKNKHERSDCEGSTCQSTEGKSLNDKALTSGNVSTAMFAVGGAAAAVGIFLAVWAREKKPEQKTALQFSPALAQGYVGGSARGVW
jgi:hypothetical protein